MRLVCPNCEAKYEVPDDAIPDTGRDVQCANCGHAWFQMRPRPAGSVLEVTEEAAEPAAAAQPEVSGEAPDDDAPDAQTPVVAVDEVETTAVAAEPEPPVEPVAVASLAADENHTGVEGAVHAGDEAVEAVSAAGEAEVEAEADAANANALVEADEDEAPEAEPEAGKAESEADAAAFKGPTGYAVDESVLAILREEAEREAMARRAEAAPLETQADLGLDAAPPVSPVVASETEGGGKSSARRDLFPDVEEINSTLRPEEFPVEEPEEAAEEPSRPERRGGFRSGFLTVMTVAILASALYMAAPQLRSTVPALDEPLAGYVAAVDGLRLHLDGMMRSATMAINGN
jgi:predicted Zn finger-like uncharacterized protein